MHPAMRHILGGFWLTGPIFDKELRVSSRRRRNYLLRVGYITLLALLLSVVWAEEVGSHGDDYTVSRMARAGQAMVGLIVWFQFVACQLLAIVMLSTAISGEVYHRTLGVLMTTPINSLQIVFGKLLSKLWQLILLLAISLPLLAIIRVFGGIPWGFVVKALTITLSATLFVGALSLFYSIYLRRSYVVIIVTFITVGVLYLFIPVFTIIVGRGMIANPGLEQFFFYVNPFFALTTVHDYAMNPGRAAWWQGANRWLSHCGIMLAASAMLLAWSVARVRIAALKQIAGGAAAAPPSKNANRDLTASPVLSRPIESIRGCPIRWKEFRSPLLGRYRWLVLGMSLLLLIPLVILYAYVGGEGDLDDEYVHMAFVAVYMGYGMLFTIVIPATGITAEKESQSWPVLLGTTIGDGAILMGKFWGALRRCLWAWVPLLAHVLIFTLMGRIIHPIAALGVLLVIVGTLIFHIGSGLYFSTLSKRTTTAVVLNFILPALVWLLIPMLLFLVAELADTSDSFAGAYVDGIPLFQSIALMEGGVPGDRPIRYRGPHMRLDGAEILFYLLVTTTLYSGIGFMFAWRAKCRFRRNIFK